MRSVIYSSAVQPGAKLEHAAYERLKRDLLRTAQERGFLDATLTRHELVVDPEQRAADVRVALETGGRYQFGVVTIEQDVISDRLFAGFVRFAEGQPYSPERIRSTQFALEDSNFFSTITVVPGDRDPETLTVPVTIRGEPIKRDRYSVSAGYGTDTGVRGKFTWENRRANRRGHRMQVELTASSVLTEAIARYIIPVGDPSLEKLEFSTGYISEEIGDLESERFEIIGGLTEAMGRWQRVLFLKLNQERTIFPGRHRPDRPAAHSGRELFQPAAQLPDRLGARCRLLLRAQRQPGDAWIGRLVSALHRARGAGLADLRPLVPAAARRGRCELGQRLLRAARLAALLRRRRSQRARLRAQRAHATVDRRMQTATRPRVSVARTGSSAASRSSATSFAISASPCSTTPAMRSTTGATRSSTRSALGYAGSCR